MNSKFDIPFLLNDVYHVSNVLAAARNRHVISFLDFPSLKAILLNSLSTTHPRRLTMKAKPDPDQDPRTQI